MEIKEYHLEPSPRPVTCSSNQDDIYLSVKIGNGQIGGNKVTSNDQPVAKGDLSEPAHLGKACDLTSSTLKIETNVLDVNGFTNSCVITTRFSNQDNQTLFTKIDKGDAPESGVASFTGIYLLKIATMVLLMVCIRAGVHAQQSAGDMKFQDLETPAAPGLILFDQTPSSIEKPTTPQGLGLSLLNIYQGNAWALEFAPFWLTDHPDLTARKLRNKKMPFIENFSVSVASIQSDSARFLAGGFRTRLLQHYGGAVRSKLDATQASIVDELSQSPADIDLAKVDSLRKKYIEFVEKPTFHIDLAAALGGASGTNSFDDLALNRWAAWLSLNWRPGGEDFYCTFLTRYVNREEVEDVSVAADLMDIGMRLNRDINAFSLSLEYLQRLNFTSETYDDYRIAAAGNYEIMDNIFLTATFGKNFSETGNIIALASVNFGFSKTKMKAF